MKTPFLSFSVYHQVTALQFSERTQQQQLEQLFVTTDAPRQKVLREKKTCVAIRNIIKKINRTWSLCTRFENQHPGCKRDVNFTVDRYFSQTAKRSIQQNDGLPFQPSSCLAKRIWSIIGMLSDTSQLAASHWQADKYCYFKFSCFFELLPRIERSS